MKTGLLVLALTSVLAISRWSSPVAAPKKIPEAKIETRAAVAPRNEGPGMFVYRGNDPDRKYIAYPPDPLLPPSKRGHITWHCEDFYPAGWTGAQEP